MDEHANLKNESSGLKTIPLSASAKTLCKDESFNMETAVFKASTSSPFLPSPTSRLDRKGEGEKRKEGDQKSLSFLEEGEKRSKIDNPQKSLTFLEEDPLDVELGLGLDLGLELELSQASSSSSSEDELPSLQQILDRTARPPDTPEKGTFTAPSTPVGPRHHSQLVKCYFLRAVFQMVSLWTLLKSNALYGEWGAIWDSRLLFKCVFTHCNFPVLK